MKRQGSSEKSIAGEIRKRLIPVASVLAIASLIFEYGFYLSDEQESFIHTADLVIVSLFLLDLFLSLLFAPRLKKALVRSLPAIGIALAFGIQLLLVKFVLSGRPQAADAVMGLFRVSSLTKFYFLILQGYIIFTLVFYTQKISRRLAHTRFRPAKLLVAAFAIMILAGTLLLLLPKATPAGKSLSFIDALFTSTSAVCVTGLIVVDTATAFSQTGQVILMLLIQIGGLGIMTFAAFFTLLSGRGFSIKEGVVFGEFMQVELMRNVSRLVVSILTITLIIEALGSVLFFHLIPHEGMTAATRIFSSVFHSISGFCNAGFSTFSDGFMSFAGAFGLSAVMAALIVLGGLGFTVHNDLLCAWWAKVGRRKHNVKLRLQTRVVLLTSIALLLTGGIMVYVFERGEVTPMQAAFQGVTARTAGFSTVAQNSLREESQLLTMFLMFIGAAPGSTGGGIKVTTLVVFLATVMGMLRGRSRTELSHKTIPNETVREAQVIFGLSLFAVVFAFMLLLAVESAPFKSLLFETVSAFGTVGLSLGATPHLSTAGKLIITITMLFGRLGPMTIALAVSGRLMERGYTYPHEKMMIG